MTSALGSEKLNLIMGKGLVMSDPAKSKHQKEPDDLAPVPGKGDYSAEAMRERLTFIASRAQDDFPRLKDHHLESRDMKGRVENFIGAIQIPVGLAGPLLFQGQDA
jgi:hydroxymethylglutaryl-CoA reductase